MLFVLSKMKNNLKLLLKSSNLLGDIFLELEHRGKQHQKKEQALKKHLVKAIEKEMAIDSVECNFHFLEELLRNQISVMEIFPKNHFSKNGFKFQKGNCYQLVLQDQKLIVKMLNSNQEVIFSLSELVEHFYW